MIIPQGSASFREKNPHLYPSEKSPKSCPHLNGDEGVISFGNNLSTEESKLNKTERAYLEYLRSYHDRVGIQRITFKLADDCRFTPDFDYIDREGHWTFVDVKGFQREDALIKIKVAARMLHHLRFAIVKRDSSGWNEQIVRP